MRRRSFLHAVTLVPLLLLGCGRSNTGPSDAANTATNEEELRIVVLAPALGVICEDLGLRERIVGKHAWDMTLPASVPVVGTHDDPDLEAILRADPTHILLQDMQARVPASLTEMAERQGWTVWAFPLLTLDDIAECMDEIHLRIRGLGDTEPDLFRPETFDPTNRLARELPSARLADAWRDRGDTARAAGRVLVLASTDPPGAMGPGSFHHQLLERLGAEPALADGGPWQELDHEDILRLAPDAIIVFRPRDRDAASVRLTTDDALAALGGIADLDIPAVRSRRVAVIDDPLGLLPASSLAGVAEEMGEAFERWEQSP
jgi:ABC-type Fe3+-hydroxamate transport system substrate-binding protein